jgi:hypothetical protein
MADSLEGAPSGGMPSAALLELQIQTIILAGPCLPEWRDITLVVVGLLVLHVPWAVLSLPVSVTFQERHGTSYMKAGPIDMTGRVQDKASCIRRRF